jgi:hypothetical protein
MVCECICGTRGEDTDLSHPSTKELAVSTG